MSWDVYVMNLPPGLESLDDIPKDYEPPPLGLRADIIAKISALYPAGGLQRSIMGTARIARMPD